jgi:hypothetical protein
MISNIKTLAVSKSLKALETNEFQKVDTVLQFLLSSKPSSAENFHCHVQNLELCIEDIENGVELLS